MAKRSVVVMPGDGIGQVVLPEALRVLEAAGFDADWVEADIGWDFGSARVIPCPRERLIS